MGAGGSRGFMGSPPRPTPIPPPTPPVDDDASPGGCKRSANGLVEMEEVCFFITGTGGGGSGAWIYVGCKVGGGWKEGKRADAAGAWGC